MILERIVRHKRRELLGAKRRTPLKTLAKLIGFLPKKKPVFIKALLKSKPVAVIAEIKRKSPSAGILRKNFNPVMIAREYEAAGAAALSVLTDEKFFGGSSRILKQVRRNTALPILRKDFTLEAYHVYEARLMGADAVLLIAAILSVKQLRSLSRLASKLGLDALVEVHTEAELKKALRARPTLIGVNNRDLKTFRVDLQTTARLAKHLPKRVILVSESGIKTAADLRTARKAGARAVLVGESLMKARNIKKALLRLRKG